MRNFFAIFFSLIFSHILFIPIAKADKGNDFSVSILIGETYSFQGARVSLWSFDLTSTPGFLAAGTRLWKNNTYAGFGLGINPNIGSPGWYGMVGHEWRPFSFVGLFAEGNGHMTAAGNSSALFLLGVNIGW